jgi:hypothetical protein
MIRASALLLLFLLPACDALPRDPEGTLHRVESTQRFTVGMTRQSREGQILVHAIERRTGAKAQWRSGDAEPMLQALSKGKLDLVIGAFAKDSPWATDVAFAPALISIGPQDKPIEIKAAMRNGENRWIMTVERASRAIAQEARAQ